MYVVCVHRSGFENSTSRSRTRLCKTVERAMGCCAYFFVAGTAECLKSIGDFIVGIDNRFESLRGEEGAFLIALRQLIQ